MATETQNTFSYDSFMESLGVAKDEVENIKSYQDKYSIKEKEKPIEKAPEFKDLDLQNKFSTLLTESKNNVESVSAVDEVAPINSISPLEMSSITYTPAAPTVDMDSAFPERTNVGLKQMMMRAIQEDDNDDLEKATMPTEIEDAPTIEDAPNLKTPNLKTPNLETSEKNIQSLSIPYITTKKIVAITTENESKNYDTHYSLGLNPEKSVLNKKLTEMSIEEVQQYQNESLMWQQEEIDGKQRVSDNNLSSASGKIQIIKPTLDKLVDEGKIKKDEIFNEDTQNKIWLILADDEYLNKRDYGYKDSSLNSINHSSWVNIVLNPEKTIEQKLKATQQFQLGLSTIWAAIPVPYDTNRNTIENGIKKTVPIEQGASFYAGVGNNAAHGKAKEFTRVLLNSVLPEEQQIEGPPFIEEVTDYFKTVSSKIINKLTR